MLRECAALGLYSMMVKAKFHSCNKVLSKSLMLLAASFHPNLQIFLSVLSHAVLLTVVLPRILRCLPSIPLPGKIGENI